MSTSVRLKGNLIKCLVSRAWFSCLILTVICCGSGGCKKKSATGTNAPTKLPDEITRKLSALNAAGIPTSREEWDQWYAKLPGDTGVGTALREAYSKITLPDSLEKHFKSKTMPKLPIGSAPLAPAFKKQISDVLSEQADALCAIKETLNKGKCRYSVEDSSTAGASQRKTMTSIVLREASVVRQGTELCQLAAYNQIESGNTADAVQAIIDGVALSDTLAEGVFLACQLARYAALGRCEDTLQRLLNRTRPSEAQLERIENCLSPIDLQESVKLCVTSHRCSLCEIIKLPFSDQEKMLGGFYAAEASGQAISTSGVTGPQFIEDYEKSAIFAQDILFMLEVYELHEKVGSTPFPQCLEYTKDAERSGRIGYDNRYIFSALSNPAWAQFERQKLGLALARIRLMRTAVAMERFRLKHNGQLPDRLDGVSAMLSVVDMQDPFDGKPLRLQKKAGGYVLYSIGPDGVDNGGLEKDANGKLQDIVFTVAR